MRSDLIGKGQGPRIHHQLATKIEEHAALLLRARRCEYASPHELCNLHGCQADAACRRMNQHRLTRRQPA